jgi:pyruvate formate lyase activating enzyme
METSAGWIFNLQRYSIHDGPGIRTTVYLKGCPLQCAWCCNPESQSRKPEIIYWQERCMRCGTCLEVCPQGAVIEIEGGWKQVDRSRCDTCGLCVEECYSGALEIVGSYRTSGEILRLVEEDRPFYDESGGGMTLSGGEPLAQPQFTLSLLQGASMRGIHTAIETSGHAPWGVWASILPYLDLILYDLKEVDPVRHARYTGVDNAIILENLNRLAETDVPIIVRRPVIPGTNDSEESMAALGEFVRELKTIRQVDLLPYHRLGLGKYERLGQEYALAHEPTLKNEALSGLQDILLSYGLDVQIGG